MSILSTDLILNPDGSVYHLHLRPENIARTIITVGDPDRVQQVSRHFDTVEFRMTKREFVTHTGRVGGKRITVISTGIGTDNVEIFFNEIDALVNIDLKTREVKPSRETLKVIRIGTSGSLHADIALGSHVISEYGVGLDNVMDFYDLPMGDYEMELSGQIRAKAKLSMAPFVVSGSAALRESLGQGMIRGNTLTCPGFYAPQGRKLRLPLRFPNLLNDLQDFRSGDFRLTNFEMETACYFGLGKLMGHAVASANAIIANRATQSFSENPLAVVDGLIKKVLERI